MANPALLSLLVTLLFYSGRALGGEEEAHDAREGDDVTLACRFAPQPPSGEPLTYYWARATSSNNHDNVAIGNIPLQTNYQIAYRPQEGVYDLQIANASYERDNGRFECRVKAGGSGRTLHRQAHALTVLTRPRAPTVAPGARAHAQEDSPVQLVCASAGGSPDPHIKWYREGSSYALDAAPAAGRSRADASTATLTLTPTRDDDGAVFRCAVWNRAMPEGERLEATVTLSVNYFPRVEVGPENPLRVELDGVATMECKVDAKPKVSSVRWTRNGKFVSSSFTHIVQGATVDDAGKYTCSADNNLGRVGEQDVYLDVLYPPRVHIDSKTHEAEEGGSVDIRCNVTANPEPIAVEWSKEGEPDYRSSGPVLALRRVTSDAAGTYVCRATNVITSAGGKRVEKTGTASVAVLVRHKPGRARISPARPVAQEGAGVTLTCAASPPGWPAPQFRWFRDTDTSSPAVLAAGSTYTIPSAHLGSEGVYRCQATNELGHGDFASVTLEVHQAPRFQTKLQPHMTRRAGETEFAVACAATGKPRPLVRWLKDGEDIAPESSRYEVKTDLEESRSGGAVNVQSALRFVGSARTQNNQLMPADRGVYSCVFENEVKRVESSMHLRIEHEPIAIQQATKVAFDVRETAEIVCRVQAYPKPEFHWYFGTNGAPLQMSSEVYYEISTSTEENDTYSSVLKIRSVRSQDYGDYFCRATNSLGQIKPQIKLQQKGAPEKPTRLEAAGVGADYVTLAWEGGFDGGLAPRYFVRWRRVALAADEGAGAACADPAPPPGDWQELDCGRRPPCNLTGLHRHTDYQFKVKAVNTRGQSDFSNEITKTTKVDSIPAAERVTYDPSTRTLSMAVGGSCLALVGVVEGLGAAGWRVLDTLPLRLAGDAVTYAEAALDVRPLRHGGRALVGTPDAADDDLEPRVRVKLCLRVNQELCGDYAEADIGPAYVKEAAALATPTLVAIVVSCLVFVLFLALLVAFCRCKRRDAKKHTAKDYEMDSVRPSMVAAQNQAPPPYYPASGMDNKALEHSMDLALAMDDAKTVYATQSGYGYHAPPSAHHAPADWVNMGYIENSYTNSNHGGSVNSQDSLWQMKMAAAAGAGAALADRQSAYGYDDYAPYPHHAPDAHAAPYPHHADAHAPRHDYCSDPYASVHKPKKRLDQHVESPYHDVSGLPEPEDAAPHMALYDDALESGYSTPSSRARRVIREIIV